MDKVIKDDTHIDVTAEVNLIWNLANTLRGAYQSDKYKEVIIPMTIIRRFECALEQTKEAVVKRFKEDPNCPEQILCKISTFQFYNTSKYTLQEIINDNPNNLASNFKSYINGFSKKVQDIIINLEFNKQIEKMQKHNLLFPIIKAFAEIDLNPKKIDNIKMGYIFEELIRKFSENAEAGDHYTGRDIVKTMVSLILAEGCEDIKKEGKIITILDQAAGTGGMLSTASDHIKSINKSAEVKLFSQEINPESYAMCLAEMLIRGQDANNIRLANTMKEDSFPDTKMRFLLENPPFGQAWGGKNAASGVENAVKDEAKKGKSGRFPAGTPGTSDMQLLFIQSAIHKMDDDKGRACIVENGSPLFSGGTTSGESQIRKWLLENDYLEAIIQLNTDMFYNTGITTYIWILSKNKRKERKGKIQLINASHLCAKLQKSLGNKKYNINKEHRDAITKLYTDFKENEFCKIFDYQDFLYKEYTIMQPLQRNYALTSERVNGLNNVSDEIINALKNAKDSKIYKNLESFMPVLEKSLEQVTKDKKILEKLAKALSLADNTADIQKDKNGNIIYDKDTKDTELIPYKVNIDDYMREEVLPFIPNAKAFFEEDLAKGKSKTGAEIPFTRYFYTYTPPQSSKEILKEINEIELSITNALKELKGVQ